MARIYFDYGTLEGFTLSLSEMAEIPKETLRKIVEAGANVVIEEQQRMLKKLDIYDTGTLQKSIQATHRRSRDGDRWTTRMIVYPYGDRGYYNRKLQHKFGYGYKFRKARNYTVGGDRKKVTNNEVGFIHEFGAPRRNIQPKQWMRLANINAEEDMVKAEAKIYYDWLEIKRLLDPE